MFNVLKKSRLFVFFNTEWTVQDIIKNSFFIALWPLLGFFSIPLRVLDFNLPLFFFLIWLAGFLFVPYHAFIVSFFGHLMFDLMWSFTPFFIFIWLTSALSSMLISFASKNFKILFLITFFTPLLYIAAFVLIASIYFPKFWIFFQVFPHITITLIFINPLFNFFVFWSFWKNSSLKKLIFYIQNK